MAVASDDTEPRGVKSDTVAQIAPRLGLVETEGDVIDRDPGDLAAASGLSPRGDGSLFCGAPISAGVRPSGAAMSRRPFASFVIAATRDVTRLRYRVKKIYECHISDQIVAFRLDAGRWKARTAAPFDARHDDTMLSI